MKEFNMQWVLQEEFGNCRKSMEWEDLNEHGAKKRFNILRDAMRKLINISNNYKILDIGCNDGLLLQPYATIFDVYGIDLNTENLRIAKSRGYKTYKHDLEKIRYEGLPFENGYFDIIICSDVIEHILDTDSLLRELNRVCKGYIIITIPNVNSCFNMIRHIRDLPPLYSAKYRSAHVRDFTDKTIKSALENHSFKVIDLVGFSELTIQSKIGMFIIHGLFERIFKKIPRMADKLLIVASKESYLIE